ARRGASVKMMEVEWLHSAKKVSTPLSGLSRPIPRALWHRWRRGLGREPRHWPHWCVSGRIYRQDGRSRISSSAPQYPLRPTGAPAPEIDARITEIDRRLKAEFPDFSALARPEPLSIEDAAQLLHPDEALVLLLAGDAQETFVWALTRTGA